MKRQTALSGTFSLVTLSRDEANLSFDRRFCSFNSSRFASSSARPVLVTWCSLLRVCDPTKQPMATPKAAKQTYWIRS